MSAPPLLDVRVFEALADSRLSAGDRDRVVDLCESAVAIACAIDLPHRGRTARCAALLLLDDAGLDLDPRRCHHLARLCELAAIAVRP